MESRMNEVRGGAGGMEGWVFTDWGRDRIERGSVVRKESGAGGFYVVVMLMLCNSGGDGSGGFKVVMVWVSGGGS